MGPFWGFVHYVSFLRCIVTLAVSPAKWETFKRMIITLVAVAAGVFVIGGLSSQHPAFRIAVVLDRRTCGLLQHPPAAIAGMLHVRAIKN